MRSRNTAALGVIPLFAILLAAATPGAPIPSPAPRVVLPLLPTVAGGYHAPKVLPSPGRLVGIAQQPFVGITLQSAIAMALLKNPNLAIAASNTRIASYQIQEAKGAFDVRFMVEPSVKHDLQAPQNAFFSGPAFGAIVQNTQSLQGGVNGELPGGQQYSVGISQSKIDDNTIINSFNPYYATSFNVALTQPLLKNFGINAPKRNLELSILSADASQAQALVGVSSTIASVEDTYWNLVNAWRAVAIDEAALRQATLQQASNVRLAKRGAAAPIDAVESSTQVSAYQQAVFEGLQQVTIEQNTLKALVLADPADPIWRANLVPSSSVLHLPRVPSYGQLLALALKNRPEVRQVADAAAQAAVNVKYAKNQTLPQADLQLQYQSNGLAGTAVPPISGSPFGSATPPPYLVGGLGQSYNNLTAGKFPTYSVGVAISLPLGNNTARGALAVAREQALQAKLQGANIRERIVFDVRNALQAYQTALASLSAARQARESAAQVYSSEQRKFHSGASTTFLVLQRQVELVQAQGRELRAQTALNQAVVELQRVDGSILRVNNVQLGNVGTQALNLATP